MVVRVKDESLRGQAAEIASLTTKVQQLQDFERKVRVVGLSAVACRYPVRSCRAACVVPSGRQAVVATNEVKRHVSDAARGACVLRVGGGPGTASVASSRPSTGSSEL